MTALTSLREYRDKHHDASSDDATGVGRPGPDTTSDAVATSEELVARYLPLARNIARRFRHRGVDFDDLEQVARIGLIKAARRWRPERCPFVVYATPTIDGELKRYFRDWAAPIRIPRVLYETQPRVAAAQRALRQRMSHEPNTAEIAAEAGIPEQRVRSVQTAVGACQQPLSTDDDSHGIGGDTSALEIADQIAGVANRTDLRAAVAHLPPRERRIIALRFVWDQNQTEIAQQLGISQMQVSRILRHAIDALRADMDAAG